MSMIIRTPKPSENAWDCARYMQRYGHRDWMAWRRRDGVAFYAPVCAANIKQALLDVGTQGHYTLYVDGGAGMLMKWALGVNHYFNIHYYETGQRRPYHERKAA